MQTTQPLSSKAAVRGLTVAVGDYSCDILAKWLDLIWFGLVWVLPLL